MSSSRGVIDLGLVRIQNVMKALGSPENEIPMIHIAGTNGKGSVCSYLSEILQKSSLRTGIFTSPHLVNPTDSIKINNKPINPNELNDLQDEILAAASKQEQNQSPLTSFELLTGVAFLYFNRKHCDVAVVEVGLGGRLDSTNIIKNPVASVITSIGLDHCNFLGNCVTDIAKEKSGIIKCGCPVLIGEEMSGDSIDSIENQEVIKVIQEKCEEEGCELEIVPKAQVIKISDLKNEEEIDDFNSDSYGNTNVKEIVNCDFPVVEKQICESRNLRYGLGMQGGFQLQNSSLAVATAVCLRKRFENESKSNPFYSKFGNITDSSIRRAMVSTKWRGRLEWATVPFKHQSFQSSQSLFARVLIDGAHNPAAAKSLREYLNNLHGKNPQLKCQIDRVIWIFGMSSGKDVSGVLNHLIGGSGDSVYACGFTPPCDMPWVKSMDGKEIIEGVSSIQSKVRSDEIKNDGMEPGTIQIVDDIREGIDKALCELKNDMDLGVKSVVCVAGSLYLVSDFVRAYD